jgi:hypothetical protein
MFNRLMILGIAAVVFVLGANYLLVYTLKKERERQDRVYWNTFNAIAQFGQHPQNGNEQKAKGALEDARQRGLAALRMKILQKYFDDLEHCYQGEREYCRKVDGDMNDAIRAPAGP